MVIYPVKVAKTFPHINFDELLNFLEESEYVFLPEDDNIDYMKHYGISYNEVTSMNSLTAALEDSDMIRIKIRVAEDKCLLTAFFLGTLSGHIAETESEEDVAIKAAANEAAQKNLEALLSSIEEHFKVKIEDGTYIQEQIDAVCKNVIVKGLSKRMGKILPPNTDPIIAIKK